MRSDLACYANVQADRVRMVVADACGRLMAGTILVLTLSALCVVAVTMVMLGVAGWFATLLDGKLWLAAGLTGVLTLVVVGSAVLIGIHIHRRRRLSWLRDRYRREPTAEPTPDSAGSPGANHAK